MKEVERKLVFSSQQASSFSLCTVTVLSAGGAVLLNLFLRV